MKHSSKKTSKAGGYKVKKTLKASVKAPVKRAAKLSAKTSAKTLVESPKRGWVARIVSKFYGAY